MIVAYAVAFLFLAVYVFRLLSYRYTEYALEKRNIYIYIVFIEQIGTRTHTHTHIELCDT